MLKLEDLTTNEIIFYNYIASRIILSCNLLKRYIPTKTHFVADLRESGQRREAWSEGNGWEHSESPLPRSEPLLDCGCYAGT